MHEIYNAIYSVDLYLCMCIYLFIENKLTRISSVYFFGWNDVFKDSN